MADDDTIRIRGAQVLPTTDERRAIARTLKPRALAGDVTAAAALATLELVAELRRARRAPAPPVLR